MAPGLTNEPAVAGDANAALNAVTRDWDDTLSFYLNGLKMTLENPDPEITLLEYLRGIGLTGTKLGCSEGGCGACTVVVSQYNPTTKKLYHASVNACLAPLVSVDGKHVITVEGIGNVQKPHPAQERIAKFHGSQCGFCTPGIVMSLYALLRNNPEPTEHEIEEAFDGNLCRCTGYRPILDAAQTFSNVASVRNGGCCNAGPNGEIPEGCCMRQNGSEEANGEGNGATDGSSSSESEIEIKSQPNGKPSHAKYTPAGFGKHKPESELIFPPALKKYDFKPLVFGNKRKRWFRPATLDQLLAIKDAYPSAKIIAGSTETQIEIKFKAMQYAVSVYVGDVAELRQHSFEQDHWRIGANMTLTDLEHIAKDAVTHYGPVRAQNFEAVFSQLRYFAGRQIRNVGTPAGNLATASPISDLNPVFVASRTMLIAHSLEGGEVEIPMTEFFKGYRTTALPPKAIIAYLKVPVNAEKGEYFRAYKQAKRKDDDIAIVNAALRVSLGDNGVVESCNLVYGGMAPTTISAKSAEKALTGAQFGNPAVLEEVMNALESDFTLSFGVPGGMAAYRKALAFGFFYKFWHEVVSLMAEPDLEADKQAIGEIQRAISSGSRDQDSAVAYEQRVLGKGVPHVAAMKQVTGEAQYIDDIPSQKNETYGCLVLSTKARAKIKSVDSSAAMDIAGVITYVDATDLPDAKANWWGAPVCDEVFFAVDEVFSVGQPIGLVVAESALIAALGARAVRVEYEVLPAILTLEEAIEKDSYFKHFHYIVNGEPIEEALESADRIITGVTRMGGQEHFYLETNAALAIPKPEDGEMEVWSSTQNPTEVQTYVAQVTGVPANRIVTKVKRLGGGFGGKETRSVQLAAICACAARKLRRPVRCMLNRDEDILTCGQRHPFIAHWRVGISNDGKFVALDADVFANAGWTQDLSGSVVDRALSHVDGCYAFPNINVRGRLCKTNTVSNTAFRGFGGPQGMFIAESIIEQVADAMAMEANKLRELNFYAEGEKTHFNQPLHDWHVPIMWDRVKEETDYAARQLEIDEFNAKSKWNKRGLAMIPTKFGISFTAIFLNQAGALVHIYHDGSVLVAHGGTEMGQGLHTKMTMIAAEALGVPLEAVLVSETATNTVANTSATAASASSDLNGYAIFNACAQLNERLQPYREKLGPKATMKELAHAAYFDRVNLSANGFYKTPEIGYVWGPNTGQMFFYFTQGVTAAEVEIDTLTGDWTCLRADIKMDIGRSINPAVDYGQIEGAFVQGAGLFTTEESLWMGGGPMAGRPFTTGPGNYKIPGFRDIPQVFNVSMLKDVPWENLRTIQRSKGVGEPPLFMGSAVYFAIRNAIKAARTANGEDGVFTLLSPATPERIRVSCNDEVVKRAAVERKEGEKSFFVYI